MCGSACMIPRSLPLHTMSDIRGRSHERKLAAEANALWFLVLWEDGKHSPVPRKAIEGGNIPEVGEKVVVKEKKKTYEGEVIEKGTKREVYRRAEELEESSTEEELEEELEEEELPPPKKKKTMSEDEAKEAKKIASQKRTCKKKARETLQRNENMAILTQLGLIATSSPPPTTTTPTTTTTSTTPPTTTTSTTPPTTTTSTTPPTTTTTPPTTTTSTTPPTTPTTTPSTTPSPLQSPLPSPRRTTSTTPPPARSTPPLPFEDDCISSWSPIMPETENIASLHCAIMMMKDEVMKKLEMMEAALENLDTMVQEIKVDMSRLKRKGSTQVAGVSGASGGTSLRMDTSAATSTTLPTLNGSVVLGDPTTETAMEVQGVAPEAIRNAEVSSTEPGRLAVQLLTALFKPEELATKNCTKAVREDIGLLDQRKIKAIRAHLQYKYPVGITEEARRWKDILKYKMNTKCRNCRQKLSKTG